MTNPELRGSGCLSAENADDSARRLAWLLDTVGLDQQRCAGWTAYPWYINRAPQAAELDAGVDPLRQLLTLLPHIRVAILCGAHAQDSWKRLARRYPRDAARCRTVSTYPTSNRAFFVAEPEQSARKLRQLYAFAEGRRRASSGGPRLTK